MSVLHRPIHNLWLFFSVAVAASLGLVLVVVAVPRYRWRAQILELKATGGLPNISWTELVHLSRHGDPFNVKGLLQNPNPYITLTNPFSTAADVAAGGKIFDDNCSKCHGVGAVGGTGAPALKNHQMRNGGGDWAIFKTISTGISGTAMPASTLPEDLRWRVVAWVKSLSQAPPTLDAASPITRIGPVRYEDILAGQRESSDPQGSERRAQGWLTYSGSYDGRRFSPIDQITKSNVSQLRLIWNRQYDTSGTEIETSPLVVGEFMFLTLPPNRVEALDARTGAPIWHYDRSLPEHLSVCCGYVNRGLAVLGGLLYLGTLDAHLVALDIRTGAVVWDVPIADYRTGYSITGAPLAYKNMVVTGVAGGEFGVRGFVTARDARTGKEIWRFDTIPKLGEPAADSWEMKEALKTGGGPTWLTGTFDPELNLLYWPVGNPSPNYEGDTRQGDNLYTDSVVALDADAGNLRWYFQFTPHDQFDWDATEILVLFDKIDGGERKRLIAQADRNAFYYVLDREKGTFRTARAFTKQTWASAIDDRGRPVDIPAARPTPQGATVYPSVAGAANWMSPSYSPVTGLMYVPVIKSEGNYFTAEPKYNPGEYYLGGSSRILNNPPEAAAVRAMDASTGEMKWEYPHESWAVGGLLSTKGGLVFGGLGQLFLALDADTGRELWRVDAGGNVRAGPVTYSIDGRQFVTVAAGRDVMTFSR